jgi:hypothetical protein
LLDAFNENMAENFMPSWINCIDESMSVWFSEYTCPGWMFVPQKPQPFGNEYHVEFYGRLSLLKEKISLGSWISLTLTTLERQWAYCFASQGQFGILGGLSSWIADFACFKP